MNLSASLQRLQQITTGNELRAQLLRGGIGSLSIKVANTLLAFAVAVVLARLLGPDGYGAYSFVLAIIILAAVPAQVGVPQLVVRETAKAQASGNYALMRGVWRWGNIAVAVFSAVALAVLGAIVWFTEIGGDGVRISTMTVGIVLIPIIALANVRSACLRGLRKVVQGQLPEGIVRPAALLALVFIWTAWPVEDGLTPQLAIGFYVIAAILSFAVGAWLLHQARPDELGEKPNPQYQGSGWRRAVVPLAMIAGLQLMNNHADLIVLGVFRPDEEVGIYRAVMQLALLVAFGFHMVGKVIQPYLAEFYETSDQVRMQKLVSVSGAIVFFYGLVVCGVLFVLGGHILSIVFGSPYAAGWLALAILSLGKLFYAGMGIAWHSLNMSGHQFHAFKVAAVAVVVNVALNIFLVPLYGMEGAASATSIAFLLFFFLMIRTMARYTGVTLIPHLGRFFSRY